MSKRIPEEFWNRSVSPSMLATFLTCKEEFRLKYVERWSPRKTSTAAFFGTIVHHILANHRKEKKPWKGWEKWKKSHASEIPKDPQALETLEGMAEIVCKEYQSYYGDENWESVSVEGRFKKSGIVQVPLTGIIDYVFRRKSNEIVHGTWMLDTKTGSSLNESEHINYGQHNVQFLIYMLYLDSIDIDCRGYVVDLVKRPTLKQNGPLVLYLQRIRTAIRKKPETYFSRIEIVVTPQELLAFKVWLRLAIQDMLDWGNGKGVHYYNPIHLAAKHYPSAYRDAILKNDFGRLIQKEKK